MDIGVITRRFLKHTTALFLTISIVTIGAAGGRDILPTPLPDELRLVPKSIILDLSGLGARSAPPVLARSPALATLALLETAAVYHADPAPASPTINPSDGACPSASKDFPGSARVLSKPPFGRRADVTIRANHLLSLDFSPFDAQLLPHDRDLTLIFDDDSVIVLHRVTQAGKVVAAAFRLPDGSIISLCDLLGAVPQSSGSGATDKIPQLKIPQDMKIRAE